MKFAVGLLGLFAACAIDSSPPDVIAMVPGGCDDWQCGTNSPLIGGLGFHELNLDGSADDEGFTLGAMRLNGVAYRVDVTDASLAGFDVSGNKVEHNGLLGAVIDIHYSGRRYSLRIDDVNRDTHYWATLDDHVPTFESYVFTWNDPAAPGPHGPVWTYLCPHTDTPDLDQYHATVFAGERINAVSKTILPNLEPRWFNIGCAGSTLAKLQLTGRTQGAADEALFSTTISERQAMVKMLSADYCGDGTAFTVAGQPLQWKDPAGTLTYINPLRVYLEAAWTSRGAACLDVPRVVADPSANASATFTYDVVLAIAKRCTIPTCDPLPTRYSLLSANPMPLLGKLTP